MYAHVDNQLFNANLYYNMNISGIFAYTFPNESACYFNAESIAYLNRIGYLLIGCK